MNGARIYRRLLVLYPRRFRDEFGADLVQLFEDQCRDDRTHRVVARAALDLAISIPTLHLEDHMNRSTLRRAEPASGLIPSDAWWKLLVAGPVLIGAVIVGAGVGIEAWFLGLATVGFGIASIVAGLVLGVVHLVGGSRRSGGLAT